MCDLSPVNREFQLDQIGDGLLGCSRCFVPRSIEAAELLGPSIENFIASRKGLDAHVIHESDGPVPERAVHQRHVGRSAVCTQWEDGRLTLLKTQAAQRSRPGPRNGGGAGEVEEAEAAIIAFGLAFAVYGAYR